MLDLEKLKELEKKSTRVVQWYVYPEGDGYHPGQASVRGPFGRWLLVNGADDAPAEEVATKTDDAKFAAAAMNNFLPLIEEVERLRKEVAEVRGG